VARTVADTFSTPECSSVHCTGVWNEQAVRRTSSCGPALRRVRLSGACVRCAGAAPSPRRLPQQRAAQAQLPGRGPVPRKSHFGRAQQILTANRHSTKDSTRFPAGKAADWSPWGVEPTSVPSTAGHAKVSFVQETGRSASGSREAEAATPLLVARCSSSVHGSNLEVDCAAARATVSAPCHQHPTLWRPGCPVHQPFTAGPSNWVTSCTMCPAGLLCGGPLCSWRWRRCQGQAAVGAPHRGCIAGRRRSVRPGGGGPLVAQRGGALLQVFGLCWP
jgi:hypothetical protein